MVQLMKTHFVRTLAVLCFLLAVGCSSAYFAAMEKIGIPKRDLMVSRVKEAKQSQEDAKKQFKSALELFGSVVKYDGGKLQERYTKLSDDLKRSESSAEKVRKRISAVEEVSEALFDEWEAELSQFQNQSLRRSSQVKLANTKQRYQTMISAMKRAESKLEPVLRPLRDNVLFLKHNLNAEAIGSLDGELMSVQSNVDVLVRELEQSINESNAFINQLSAKD